MNKHLSDRRLLVHLEETESHKECERVQAHLSVCPMCLGRLETLAQIEETLTSTLESVGERVPVATSSAWEAVSQRIQRNRSKPVGSRNRGLLRHLATFAVIAVLVGGLAGLIHTVATTGPGQIEEDIESAPTPDAAIASPSAALEPLRRPYPDHLVKPVSLLILGCDGEHDTSEEIDALMLLHLDPSGRQAFLLSIPENLYVTVADSGEARIDTVYRLGEVDQAGNGLALARASISAALELPVDHAVLVSFDAFSTLIDAIGGIDIEVPHSIEDPAFPDDRGGYDPLLIPAGKQHFDGASALLYARTRVVPDPNFDRGFRQRQIVVAAHDRVNRLNLLPGLIAQAPDVWTTVADSLETDVSLSNAINLALLTASLSRDDIATAALDDCCTEKQVISGRTVALPLAEETEALIDDLLEGER